MARRNILIITLMIKSIVAVPSHAGVISLIHLVSFSLGGKKNGYEWHHIDNIEQ